MSEEKSIDRKNNITFTELDSRDIKDIWQAFEEVLEQHPDAFKGDPPVDLEYAHKLARTLRWRTWPEEKPDDETEIVLINQQRHVSPSYFYKREKVYNMLGLSFPISDGDKWMYLSDLEVVR